MISERTVQMAAMRLTVSISLQDSLICSSAPLSALLFVYVSCAHAGIYLTVMALFSPLCWQHDFKCS